MFTNDSTKGFKESSFALDRLHQLYAPIFAFSDRLYDVLLGLIKTKPGFMVSCVRAHSELLNIETNSLLMTGDKITFGENNVKAALALEKYLSGMRKEFKQARRSFDELIKSLYPPIASLHACQQAAISGDENAINRFKQEKAEYVEIIEINQTEIDILQNFRKPLDEVEKDMKDLLPSTIGIRNRELIESPDFSYLKP